MFLIGGRYCMPVIGLVAAGSGLWLRVLIRGERLGTREFGS